MTHGLWAVGHRLGRSMHRTHEGPGNEVFEHDNCT
jgi:hypothetical protein